MTSAAQAVQQALVEALQGSATLIAAISGVYDGPPPRAAFPYIALADGAASDWGTKTEAGREIRLALTIWDDGEEPQRLQALIDLAEEAIAGMSRDLDGWRVASLAFLRSRIVRDASGPWAGLVEYRIRVLAAAQTPGAP